MTTINWDQLRQQAATGPELLPKGEYIGKPKSAQAKKTNDGSKEMLVVQFDIIAGPAAGKTLWNNFVLSPENANSLGFFFEHMAAMGIGPDAFAQQPNMETLASWVVQLARPVILSVSHSTYQGKLRNQVDGLRAYGQDGTAAVPPAPGAIAAPPAPPVAPVAAPAPVPAITPPVDVPAPAQAVPGAVAPPPAPVPVAAPPAPAPVAPVAAQNGPAAPIMPPPPAVPAPGAPAAPAPAVAPAPVGAVPPPVPVQPVAPPPPPAPAQDDGVPF